LKLAEAAHAAELSQAATLTKLAAAEQTGADLKAQLEQVQLDAAARETAIREQERTAAQSTVQSQLNALQLRIEESERARIAAEQQRETEKASHETIMNERLREQREALEKSKIDEVNAERAKRFERETKLETQLQDIQRQLQEKTAAELGEGAELDLFEELKHEFQDDRLRRVPKGVAGADILHEVVYNGQLCGKIIYDSKNRDRWRTEYATKLRADQIAEGADHAILSSNKFPEKGRQVHVFEGVIVACPARVLVLAELMRRHIIQTHILRLSNNLRSEKTAALYSFMTSERCAQLLDSVQASIDKLLELDVAEQKPTQAFGKNAVR
jgi:hypothetical protein